MKDRVVRILEILSANQNIRIKLLAEMLNVTLITIRKDLEILEKLGIICRTRGHISLDGANVTAKRIAINYLIKRRIAKAAAQIVEEGESVIIESGSCCAMLAEELAILKKNINIVTNSVFIVNYVSKLHSIRINLLGGYFQAESEVLIGPMTKSCAEQIYSQKYFLGTDGFIPEFGFTGGDQFCAEIAEELTNHAKDVYILTEASKFNRQGPYKQIHFDKITGVFTDDSISKEAEDTLIKNNIRLHKISTVDEKEEKLKWNQFSGQYPFLYKK